MLADSATGGETPNPDSNLTFVSYDLMHKVLAPNRIAIVRAMTGQGPMSIREAARRVGRDFKGVHSDITVLLRNGVLEKMDDGLIVFPYAKMRFDFEFGSANQSAA